METTIAAVFTSQTRARAAARSLVQAGVAEADIEKIDRGTRNHGALIGEETSNVAATVIIGSCIGGVGMAVGGWAMAGPLQLFAMSVVAAVLLFGFLGVAGGAVIGLLIGSAASHHAPQGYGHMIAKGHVVLVVNTARGRADMALEILQAAGGHSPSTSVRRKQHTSPQQSA